VKYKGIAKVFLVVLEVQLNSQKGTRAAVACLNHKENIRAFSFDFNRSNFSVGTGSGNAVERVTEK